MIENHSGETIFLAPMEGITDDIYRKVVFELYHTQGFDFYSTDFLRIPTMGVMSAKKTISHFGHFFYNQLPGKKTALQILSPEHANIEENIMAIEKLQIAWCDINIGCPSKKVNGHKGGSYLLQDLHSLKRVVDRVRKNFSGFLSAKIRIGYRDTNNFEDTISLLGDAGVQQIAIHARTKEQMYQGHANWSFIKKAKEISSVPIIGNGDVSSPADIDRMFNETNCDGVMIGRAALRNPWIANCYKQDRQLFDDQNYRRSQIRTFLSEFESELFARNQKESTILKRLKSVTKYLLESEDEQQFIRSSFLRSRELDEFKENYIKLY